jgi:hypothetical protein
MIFSVEVWARGVVRVMTGATVDLGSRYTAVPLLLLMSIVLAVASQWKPDNAHMRDVAGPLLCVLLLVPIWLVDFDQPNERSQGPTWTTEVSRASLVCRESRIADVPLRIAPTGWVVVVPCRVLR